MIAHLIDQAFRTSYQALPAQVRALADKNFGLLKQNPRHPSLRFKKVGDYWSVRVGQGYRALGKEVEGGILWGWIGTHAEYNRRIRL